MTQAKTGAPSPAKWALIGGLALGFGALLNGYQRTGELAFAVGLAIGPAVIGAVIGGVAALIKRALSK
ncbi:MAG: hypothetical protein U1C60_09345 [Rhodocyclaceae bacterium]|nr:hypothetical protein [Rhodocyclaceae bacterium]